MILMLSGEGKTDMGQMIPTDRGMRFEPGPMAWIVDKLVEKRLDYSALAIHEAGGGSTQFISEHELCEFGKRGPRLLRGIKYGKETACFTRNAQVFGLKARQVERETDQSVIAVLFRDTDNTKADARNMWQLKYESIKRGFALAEFQRGVPMVPFPKSEAWLLCALKRDAYQYCESLEAVSGNDNSPNSLKAQLKSLVGHEPTAIEQADWVKSGKIDPGRIDMPSYNAFREGLDSALAAL